MKWAFFAVWAIAAGATTYFMARHNDPAAAYCAARNLPPNHRIVAADLKPFPAYSTPILGKYVRDQAIPRGEGIRPYKLATYPAIKVADGKTPTFIPLQTAWNMQDALNAGSVVDVWAGAEQLASHARVLAVLTQGAGATLSYVAVLETGPEEAKRLAGKTTDLHILIRDFESGGQDGR